MTNVKEKNKAEKRDRQYLCRVAIWKKVVREGLTEKG